METFLCEWKILKLDPPPQINNQPQFLLTRFCEILQLPRCVILEDYYLIYLMKSIFIYITNLYSFIEMGRHTVPVYLYLNEMLPMIASYVCVILAPLSSHFCSICFIVCKWSKLYSGYSRLPHRPQLNKI